MLHFLTNQPRFVRINMELVVALLLVGVLGLIAMRKIEDMKEEDLRAQAQAIVEAGRVAVSLDFAQQLVNSGTYNPPFTGAGGTIMTAEDRAALEAMFESNPIYPPAGAYDVPAGTGFRWYLVSGGNSKPPSVPVITAITDGACPAGDSLASLPTANDDCDVRKF